MITATLPVKGLNFAGCAREIEKHLSKLDGIAQVEASYVSQTVTVTYDETRLSDTQLKELIKDCGFLCGEPWSETSNPALSSELSTLHATMPHAEHMSAMEHVDGHHAALVSQPTAPPTAHPMEGMAHERVGAAPAHAMAGMGPMEHDTSDPAMARAMEADMRNRFFVSLVLTIPVILYSPLGTSLFKLHLPTPFGISPNWLLLVLATPIVWWGGWIFHSGAWRALRNRRLGMNLVVSRRLLVGTVNGSGSLRFKATKVGSDTALAQIVQLVQTAQNSKAPAQRLADRAAEWLVLAAVSAGVLTFLVWFFVIGQTALFAVRLAVTAVVIACPDALGLATPTVVAVGTGIGARNGILIKNATALEQTSRIQAILFDKTGTLTEGTPALTETVVFAAP